MAPSKRKTARTSQTNNQKGTGSPKSNTARSNTPDGSAGSATQPGDDDSCPSCTPTSRELMKSSRKENWIECDSCNTWHHWRCVRNGEDVENIAKWCILSFAQSSILN